MNAAKARGKPYTIVFVGVNGVGKSTNLAKICYWLLQNDIKVRTYAPDVIVYFEQGIAGLLSGAWMRRSQLRGTGMRG